MDFSTMTTEQLEERRAQIAQELETEGADLDALEAEARAIKAEQEKRSARAKKQEELRSLVASGMHGTALHQARFGAATQTNANATEVRNSSEYMAAYAEYLKDSSDEKREALLTMNAGENGQIAVPQLVLDIVKTAWDKDPIMSYVNKSSIKANLQQEFEIEGSEAEQHEEGSDEVGEEELSLGLVTMVPKYIMKWKSISKEVYSMRGEAFLNYIYRELAHKIVKKMADLLIEKITKLPQKATKTSPSANKVSKAPAMGTVAEALGNLTDEATQPIVVMHRLTEAYFKEIRYANNYAADPFEGLTVVHSNKLPAYSAASAGDVYAIVGDFVNGAHANNPNGDAIEFVFDTLTKKKQGLIEVLGQQYHVADVVGDKYFALLTKPAGV